MAKLEAVVNVEFSEEDKHLMKETTRIFNEGWLRGYLAAMKLVGHRTEIEVKEARSGLFRNRMQGRLVENFDRRKASRRVRRVKAEN